MYVVVNCTGRECDVHRVRDLQRPDRRTPMKVLAKMFVFVELVWSAYADDNKPDIRHVL